MEGPIGAVLMVVVLGRVQNVLCTAVVEKQKDLQKLSESETEYILTQGFLMVYSTR